MRLRTFTAPDMPTAMKMVREAMGDHAIILSSTPDKAKKTITVTAAHDTTDEAALAPKPSAPIKPISSSSAETIRAELQQVLRFHNVPEMLISKIFNRADPRELASIEALHQLGSKRDHQPFIRLALEKTLSHYFTFQPLDFTRAPQRLMLVGTPGIGKTLTIAKLSAHLTMNKQPVSVFTTDTKRAGGVEQLQAFTTILNTDLQVTPTAEALSRALIQVPRENHVLVDTAGANPFDRDEMKEITHISALSAIEPILVLPAGGDSLEAMDIAQAFMTMPIKRLLVTRADTARRFGGIVAAAAAHKLAFSHLSNSSSIIDSIQPLDGATLTQLLLRYQLQSP